MIGKQITYKGVFHMSQTPDAFQKTRRKQIVAIILERLSSSDDRRQEALDQYFAVSMPNMADDMSAKVAALVPPLMQALYEKWANMFADSLFANLPEEQLAYLTNGDKENEAALALAYIMFMESARMEEQSQKDLEAYGREHTGEGEEAELAAGYIRAKIAMLAAEMGKKQ